jgi:ATP-dependent phosphoenolpyruvate carboxykinase
MPSTEYKNLIQAMNSGQMTEIEMEVIQCMNAAITVSKKNINYFLTQPAELTSRLSQIISAGGVSENTLSKYLKPQLKKLS